MATEKKTALDQPAQPAQPAQPDQVKTQSALDSVDMGTLIEALRAQPLAGTIEKAHIQIDINLLSTTIAVLKEAKVKLNR